MNNSLFPGNFHWLAKSGFFFALILNISNTNALPSINQTSSDPITKYEAEDAVLTGCSISKVGSGFSGTGYMDAGSFDADGDKITFTVNVATAAAYPLIIRFKNSCGACEKAQNISINGGAAKNTTFLGTSTTWQDLNAGDVDLKAGNNTITISKSWGWTSIDYIGIGENDTSAPTTPSNLSATNITQTSFSLTWSASTDNVGVSGYDVFQGNTLKSSITTTSVSISNLNCNTDYPEILVKAKDKAGNVSVASNIILVKTSPCVSYALKVIGGTGSGSFGSGKLVNVVADDAPKGKTFDKWIGSAAVTNTALATTTVLIPESDVEITATYKDIDTATLLDAAANAETVALWNYLKSVYGQKMLTGCWTETQFGGNDNVEKCAGETPAIWGQDMNSWYKSRTDPNWINTWNSNIQGFKTAHKRGQILQVNWHWQMPSSKVNGVYTRDAWGRDANNNSVMMTNQQWSDIVTPGTALYDAMIEDVDYHIVNFLKKIVDDKGLPIPIIFRPMHEIDGGWFWWTCPSDPTKTAKLYKIIQERIVNFHGCHNLIWVFNPAGTCNGGSTPPFQASELPRRKLFYPGDAFCDITGIDLYDYDPAVRASFRNYGKTYRDAWNMMKAIAPSKMIALCEGEGLPDPTKCFTDPNFAPWLYCLPWYSISYDDPTSGTTRDLCAWNKIQFKSAYAVNAGDFSITSAENHSIGEQSGISIYPNPVNGKLNLVMKEKAVKIELFDMNGRIMKEQKANSTNEIIDLSGFESGMYILKVASKNGNCSSAKILKE